MAPEQMDMLRGVSAAQLRAIELAGDRIATKLTAAQKVGARPSAASRFRPEAAGLLHARPARGYLRALRGELSQQLAPGRGPKFCRAASRRATWLRRGGRRAPQIGRAT